MKNYKRARADGKIIGLKSRIEKRFFPVFYFFHPNEGRMKTRAYGQGCATVEEAFEEGARHSENFPKGEISKIEEKTIVRSFQWAVVEQHVWVDLVDGGW